MSDIEYDFRVLEARDGETVERTREFQGQAPFLINSYLSYGNQEKALDVNLSYNVQGKNIAIVGIGRVPDVYNRPFHDLTLKISKGLGKTEEYEPKKHTISATFRNILNQKRQQIYSSYQAQDQIFTSYSVGMFFGFGYSYKF